MNLSKEICLSTSEPEDKIPLDYKNKIHVRGKFIYMHVVSLFCFLLVPWNFLKFEILKYFAYWSQQPLCLSLWCLRHDRNTKRFGWWHGEKWLSVNSNKRWQGEADSKKCHFGMASFLNGPYDNFVFPCLLISVFKPFLYFETIFFTFIFLLYGKWLELNLKDSETMYWLA